MSDRPAFAPPAPGARPAWVEYASETLLVALLMLAIAATTVMFEHPASWLRQALEVPITRRLVVGLAIGTVVAALSYSPWGQLSGAHLNPAVTLALARAGRHRWRRVGGYLLAQLLGALAGFALAHLLARPLLAHPEVSFATTTFDPDTWAAAFAAEVAVTFVLMNLILGCARSPRLQRWTGVVCGLAVVTFVVLAGPISGASMNPVRTLAAAVGAGDLGGVWLYLTAPIVGTYLAAEVQVRLRPLPPP